MVVFDGAHRLGRGERGERTERYRLAGALRPLTPAMLLLSATPHQGKTARFAALLELVRPDLRDDLATLEANPDVVTEIILRNKKAAVADAQGRLLCNGHDTFRVAVEPEAAKKAFADELVRYLRHGYDAGAKRGAKDRAIGFVMTTYRKLASSSIAAIVGALERRRERLEAGDAADQGRAAAGGEPPEDDPLQHPDLFGNRPFFANEVSQIERLLRLAAPVRRDDAKLRLFLEKIAGPVLQGGRRLLIFTEYRATQDYLQAALVRHLPEAGEPALIHGSMGLDEKLANIRRFKEDARFMVSTEAGGEGLNLHEGCHVLANYDLPWNPSKLVQRIGRLYRYGQQHRVQVFNLHIQDGFDNDALGLMLDRVEVMARGPAAVGGAARPALEAEILGQLLQAIDMEAILERAVSMQFGSSGPEIARAIEEARKAQLLQDEILSFADGFEGVGGGLLGVDGRHLRAFVEGMLPRIAARDVRAVHQGRGIRFELPEHLVDACPEFGRQRTVTVALERALARERDDVAPLDFDSAFFRLLVGMAKNRAFDGLYAAVAGSGPPGGFGVWFLRWQDKRGEMLEDELIPLWFDARGNVERLPRERFKHLLLEPAVSQLSAFDIDRERAIKALTMGLEQEARPRVGHDRQPASCHLIAAAECRE